MRISAMEEYGLRALLCLARRASHIVSPGLIPAMTIPEVAEEEGLSIPYTSKIMRRLRQSSLVTADRGRTGGYRLSAAPEDITLKQVLESLGGPLMADDHCERYPGIMPVCVHKSDCSLRGAFGGFTGYLDQILSRTTLADLTLPETMTTVAVSQTAKVLIEEIADQKLM